MSFNSKPNAESILPNRHALELILEEQLKVAEPKLDDTLNDSDHLHDKHENCAELDDDVPSDPIQKYTSGMKEEQDDDEAYSQDEDVDSHVLNWQRKHSNEMKRAHSESSFRDTSVEIDNRHIVDSLQHPTDAWILVSGNKLIN